MVGDYDDRVEQIIRLAEDLFLEKRKVVMTVRVYNRGIANPEISKRCFMSSVGMLIRANFQHRDIKYGNKSNRSIRNAHVRKKHGRYTFWMRQIELFGPF